jgi:aromatic ring-cleaving dioxygenase
MHVKTYSTEAVDSIVHRHVYVAGHTNRLHAVMLRAELNPRSTVVLGTEVNPRSTVV